MSDQPSYPIGDTNGGKPRWAEVAAVVATGLLHLVCKPLGLQGVYIVAAILAWAVFVGVTAMKRPAVVREWGFRGDNFWPALRASSTIFVPVMVLMVVLASIRGTLTTPSSLPVMLLLYPAWGLVQQFLVQALLVTNLGKGPLRHHRSWLVVGGGALFSLVHVGNPVLMLATAMLGATFVWLYLRYRNLWPLGVFHGWLASLFYLWFLHRDPFTEIFGRLLNG